MVSVALLLFGEFLCMLMPVLFGVEVTALTIPQNMATFGYLTLLGILVTYMISSGFLSSSIFDQIVIITIEHIISNYVPITILTTVGFSIYNAT